MIQPSHGYNLRSHNTLGLDATAEQFARVTSTEQLQAYLDYARQDGIPVMALGEGSNLVLRSLVPGLVLRMELTGMRLLSDDGQRLRLRVAAGENWHNLVTWCCLRGFHGLENLALIPGSVGAAPVQNIGAYGMELCQRLAGVEVVNARTGECNYLDADACQFGYRDSVFKTFEARDLIITSVDLRLDRQAPLRVDYPSLRAALPKGQTDHRAVFDTVIKIRRARLPDPQRVPNVGSFFKNPVVPASIADSLKAEHPDLVTFPAGLGQVKISAAWMIESLGWRGREREGVAVSDDHSLVLVNRGATSAVAVLSLAEAINQDVQQNFGIPLEIEPQVCGDYGTMVA